MNVDATVIATDGAKQLFEYGLLGVIIVGMTAFIVWVVKSHREERKEWRQDAKNQAEQFRQTSERMVDKLGDIARDANNRG